MQYIAVRRDASQDADPWLGRTALAGFMMAVLIAGTLWIGLVAYLLLRVLRQSRVYAAASLQPGMPRRAPTAVSIILPVRNEIANIEACLRALSAQAGLGHGSEIIVVDDNSMDGTAEQVARLSAMDPRVRLIRSGPLPTGWIGKPFACWCGAVLANTDWICFVDADVRVAPDLVAAAISAADENGVDMLSVCPFQELGSFWERLIIPVGLVLIACAMDFGRIDDPAAPDVTANGQFLVFRRDAYFAVGGHAAVRAEICEDKALADRVKRAGLRFRLLGGEHFARARMYTDLPSLWEGFSKNAVEILGDSIATIAVAMIGLFFSLTVLALPAWSTIALTGAQSAPTVLGCSLCFGGSLAVLGVHLGTAWHFRIPLRFGLLFPVAYIAVVILVWSSFVLRRTGYVKWKGRTYDVAGRGGPRAF